MATTVADAEVLVKADVSKFGSDLEKKLKPIVRAINATLDILADATSFKKTVDKTVNDAERLTATIEVEANARAATADIRRIRDDISGRPATITVKADIDRDLDKAGSKFTEKFAKLGGDSGATFSSSLTDSLTKGLGPLTSLIPTALSNPVTAGVAVILAALASVYAAALLAAGAIGGIGLGFLALGALALKGNAEVSSAFDKLIDRIQKTFSDAAEPLVKPLVKAFETIGDAIEKIGPQLEDAFVDLAPAIDALAEGFAGFIDNVMPGLVDILVASVPLITEFAKQLPGLGQALSDFFGILALAGPDSVTALKAAFIILKVILIAVASIILGLTLAFGLLVEGIKLAAQTVENFVTLAEDFLSQVPDIFIGFINEAITGAKNVLNLGISGLILIISGIPGRIISALSGLASTVSSIFSTAFSQALGAVIGGIGSIVNAVRGLGSQISSSLSGLASAAYNSGRSIISNLISGLLSKAADLKRIASNIIGSVKNLLPNSPAKDGPFSGKGAPEVSGRVIADDVAKGIKSGEHNLVFAGEKAVAALKQQFDNFSGFSSVAPRSLGSSSSTQTNTRNFAPVINIAVNSGDGNMIADALIRRLLTVGA